MSETKTYRGRTLEEVLPKIRSELGPDALVLKRREGLAGGVGGFFQRSYVEVEARGPADEPELEVRSDRATAEGLATPGIQALLAQASPFANALAAAQAAPDLGLYGPQPSPPAPPEHEPASAPAEPFVADVLPAAPQAEAAAPAPPVAPEPAPAPAMPMAPEPAVPAATAPLAPGLRAALEAAGLPSSLAGELVGEAVHHGIPFASARALKNLVRAALTRRIPVMAPLGTGPRTVAVVGSSGSGKTTAAARLAAAYRAAGTPVRELTLGDPTARERFDGLTVLDAPATGVRDADRVKELAKALRGLKAEVHLALPATISAAAAGDLSTALAPLKPTHVLLTHADETAHPGAPVAHAIATGRPLSYVSGADGLRPADASELARRLL